MDIEMDAITEDMKDLKDYNFFVAMDYSVKGDSDAILGETYFYIKKYDKYFELKYPERDMFPSDEQYKSFFKQLQVYMEEMMDIFSSADAARIAEEANLESLIDFLIVDQIMGEMDHSRKSFNMYFTNTSSNPAENGKLSFGPVCDYDWSLATPWTNEPNVSYKLYSDVSYSNAFYRAVSKIPEYYDMLCERYTQYAQKALEDYIDNYDTLTASIEKSVKLNHSMWYRSMASDLSDKNTEFLKNFLIERKRVLDIYWGK
jgi:hypothetical protein